MTEASNQKNNRKIALSALCEIFENKQSLSHLKTELTPFAQNLCFGVCRHYFELNAILNYLIKKPLKKTKVQLALLMGLYQLSQDNSPPYAVLNETVALLNKPNLAWAKGLVNGVLRRYCREKTSIHEALSNKQDYLYNYPEWLLERLKTAWPNQWKTFIKASNQKPPMSLRVNQKQHTKKAYQEILKTNAIKANPIAHTTHGIQLDTPMDVQTLPGFYTGDISVQDGAAQLAAELLQLQPGLRVLDACAAPGGKTCHILETEPNLSACIALDIEARRIQKIKTNLERLKLDANLIQADATKPKTWWDGKLFDRILLDAPCSATGVIRRHPDIKLLRTPKDVAEIAKIQKTLLEALWSLLAPGGILVYATCSILPEENELQIKAFIEKHPDCIHASEKKPWGHETGHGYQILPGEDNMDGFFYSILTKQHHPL